MALDDDIQNKFKELLKKGDIFEASALEQISGVKPSQEAINSAFFDFMKDLNLQTMEEIKLYYTAPKLDPAHVQKAYRALFSELSSSGKNHKKLYENTLNQIRRLKEISGYMPEIPDYIAQKTYLLATADRNIENSIHRVMLIHQTIKMTALLPKTFTDKVYEFTLKYQDFDLMSKFREVTGTPPDNTLIQAAYKAAAKYDNIPTIIGLRNATGIEPEKKIKDLIIKHFLSDRI